MKKKLFLILCLLGAIEMSSFNLIKNDGISVMATNCTNDDRSSYILAVINGHNLSVSFTENIGEVDIEIENVEGIIIEYNYMETPSGYLYYIPLVGRYTISFTLSNGDKYYGEFEVTD